MKVSGVGCQGKEVSDTYSLCETSLREKENRRISKNFQFSIFNSGFPGLGLQADVSSLDWGSAKNLGVDSILGHIASVGWVEPTPGFVGFVALNPTYILPVLLRNAKPNSGRFRNRAQNLFILTDEFKN